MNSGLKGKVALITGASGGIGNACARVFANEGAKLALHGNQNMNKVEKLDQKLTVETLPVQADLTKEEEVKALFKQAYRYFEQLDVLVANAGIWPKEELLIHRMSLERWNRTINTDQTSVFLCAREFFKILKRTKPESASLIIVGSTAAVFGEEGHADYAAAKAAITYGLTRSLKNEIVRLVPRGRVNAVCPGWTKTEMTEAELENKDMVTRLIQTRPIKRVGRPEEIAKAIVFLASDKLSGHITGEILTVAGGMEGRVLYEGEEIDHNDI